MIDTFSGRYSFLSNFAPVSVEYEGKTYPTVEHAYWGQCQGQGQNHLGRIIMKIRRELHGT